MGTHSLDRYPPIAMYKFLIVFALVACVYAAQAPCPGCPFEDDSNGDELLPELKKVLQQANIDEEVKTIVHVQKQVVSGVLYKVLFISENGKHCDASWLSKPWVSDQPLESKAECL